MIMHSDFVFYISHSIIFLCFSELQRFDRFSNYITSICLVLAIGLLLHRPRPGHRGHSPRGTVIVSAARALGDSRPPRLTPCPVNE